MRTLKGFLLNAFLPLGRTCYVWGGGWDADDEGASIAARTMGVNPRWEEFYRLQGSEYNFREHPSNTDDGLDCSGYVGWAVYNTMETENGRPGYVMPSTDTARRLAEDYGFGTYTLAADITDRRPGDVMSVKGHVYIMLGTCSDGSILFVHSSVHGVQLGSSPVPGSDDAAGSEACALAKEYMTRCFPDYIAKFPKIERGRKYLEEYNQFRWSGDVLTDPDGIYEKSPQDILEELFCSRE